MSERPTRSCRSKPVAPILPLIIARVNLLEGKYYENIRNECLGVSKYYKDNTEDMTNFWFTDYHYNLLDFKHLYLLNYVLSTVGLKHENVGAFLDKIDDLTILDKLGVVRVNNGKKQFYRIAVGTNA